MNKSNMTAAEFAAIKALTEIDGLSNKMVCRVSKRSGFTVAHIAKAANFEEYRQNIRDYMNRSRVKPVDTTQRTQTDISSDMVQLLQDVNEVLTSLDKRLKWVEEHAVVKARNVFGR